MKEIVQHPIYGEIIYNENFWTGKKKIVVNGVDAQPISKKEYMVNEKRALLTGNFLTGSTLHIEGEAIQLSSKMKWYEIILAIIHPPTVASFIQKTYQLRSSPMA